MPDRAASVSGSGCDSSDDESLGMYGKGYCMLLQCCYCNEVWFGSDAQLCVAHWALVFLAGTVSGVQTRLADHQPLGITDWCSGGPGSVPKARPSLAGVENHKFSEQIAKM